MWTYIISLKGRSFKSANDNNLHLLLTPKHVLIDINTQKNTQKFNKHTLAA